ncbi:hypothetical protein D9M73_118620 [compost metagenome]
MANENQPLNVTLTVNAVIRVTTFSLGQQTLTFVVANGFALGLGCLGQFSDFHTHAFRTLNSYS